MRLYHHPYSDNARRAVMTVRHLNASIDLALVDWQKGEQHRPRFVKWNPNSRAPAREDNGFVLRESHAIRQYLADKPPRQTIHLAKTRVRADVNHWLSWCGPHLTLAVGSLHREYAIKGATGRRPQTVLQSSATKTWSASSARSSIHTSPVEDGFVTAQPRSRISPLSPPLRVCGPLTRPRGSSLARSPTCAVGGPECRPSMPERERVLPWRMRAAHEHGAGMHAHRA